MCERHEKDFIGLISVFGLKRSICDCDQFKQTSLIFNLRLNK